MLRITRISEQKKRAGRFNIYLDDEYWLAASELEIQSHQLKEDRELAPEERQQIEEAVTWRKGLDLAYRYLALRPRSEQELRKYLAGKELNESTIATVLERLAEYNLVNDDEFAQRWVEERQRLRPRSQRQLQDELRQKGIARETIEAVLGERAGDDEFEAAYRLGEKKIATKNGSDTTKLLQYLSQKGFGYDVARRVVERLTSEATEGSELLGDDEPVG